MVMGAQVVMGEMEVMTENDSLRRQGGWVVMGVMRRDEARWEWKVMELRMMIV